MGYWRGYLLVLSLEPFAYSSVPCALNFSHSHPSPLISYYSIILTGTITFADTRQDAGIMEQMLLSYLFYYKKIRRNNNVDFRGKQ